MKKYKPSQFCISLMSDDGTLIIRNLFTNQIKSIPLKDTETVSNIMKNDCVSADNGLIHALVESSFLIDYELEEYRQVDAYRRLISYSGNQLDITIMPTDACNFRCKYCFEAEGNCFMEDFCVEAIIKFFDKNFAKYKRVYIQWFGGEPLLCKETIETVMQAAIRFSKRDHVALISGITTNGYLLDVKTYQMLCRNRITWIQVSVDGMQNDHNQHRPHKLDPDSYSTIIRNLKAIRDNTSSGTCRIYYRITVSKQMIFKAKEILGFYKSEFANDNRFRLSLQPVMDWGGDRIDSIMDQLPSVRDTVECITCAANMGLLTIGHHTQASSGLICESARKNGFVIYPDGRIIKCPMAIYNSDGTNIQQGVIGRISNEGTFAIDERINNEWVEGDPLFGNICRRCKYYAICHGGVTCPYSLKYSGRKINELCKKKIYDEYIPVEMKSMYNLGLIEHLEY